VLRAMVADEQQAVMGIDILPAAERQLLLEEWNATEAPYPEELCIHQLFEEQAARDPEAVALVFEDETLTYGELNARANRLAHHLIALGVKPDERVAICVERSFEMVVGLIAILKAGGAYVPLDPAYPAERLAFMLADSEPRAILTHEAARAALEAACPSLTHVPAVIDLADEAGLWAEQPSTSPDPQALGLTSRNLAYIIYTSGSTGTPKGVMVEHRSLVGRLSGVGCSLGPGLTDVMPLVSSTAFDISILELLLPLVSGAATAVSGARTAKDIEVLAGRVRGATILNAVTSVMEAWSNFVEDQDLAHWYPQLRMLLVGGEPVQQRLIDRLYALFPNAEVVETYGPTEASLYATSCLARSAPGTQSPPIGRPISNTRIYLLDSHGLPVPLGAAGEIYIGGAGVARGYLGRPELTAERFIASPFVAGDRLYKTGDLARYLPDGNIEFLGRNDHQVKIRGYRIELGEIEARLSEHADVGEAVVLAREDEPGDKRLVAYVVPAGDPSGDEQARGEWIAALRAHLATSLPEYMVPAAYVMLDALPLTPNGKLDRNALPAPGDEAFVRSAYEPPQGEVEKALAGIWSELLGIERISRHDNFFELGGHSLLAVRMISRIDMAFGLTPPLSIMFKYNNLISLAKIISVANE
jgi:amino acid adenylation domain-containing protein